MLGTHIKRVRMSLKFYKIFFPTNLTIESWAFQNLLNLTHCTLTAAWPVMFCTKSYRVNSEKDDRLVTLLF